MFFGGPRFDTGLAAHGGSHYRWIVVVRASGWWSCGVLRSKWDGPSAASSRSTEQPIAAGVGSKGKLARLASPLRREDLRCIVRRPERVMGILQKVYEREHVP